jgi:diketogulonate reductase-like aldo/keto reductase
LGKSLDALKTDRIELFYLHAPDRSTSFGVTFKALDDLHKEGKFAKVRNSKVTSRHDWISQSGFVRQLGISNYMACVPFNRPCQVDLGGDC